MTRPRVTVKATRDPIPNGQLCDPHWQVTPEVRVEVSFDLHDHDAALAALEDAASEIRAQIAETRS